MGSSLAAAVVMATLPTFAGIQLGEKPSLPECDRMTARVPVDHQLPYNSEQPRKCIMYEKIGDFDGAIVFPDGTMPTIGKGNLIMYRLVDGRIESLNMGTVSFIFASTVIAEVSSKFGKPSSDHRDIARVGDVPMPSRTVTWTTNTYLVEYRSVDTIETGSLTIDTAKFLDVQTRKAQAEDQGRTRL